MNAKHHTILIADDHPLFRKGLKDMIQADPMMNVIYEANNGEEVLEFLSRHELPDLLILDVDMPKISGLELCLTIQKKELPVQVIILTMYNEESMFNRIMDAGVEGYILKESALQDVIQGIRTVLGGKFFISPAISEYLLRRGQRPAVSVVSQPSLFDLTPMEKRVMKEIAANKSSREIADDLHISKKTVDRHREDIARKLNLHGSYALLKFAIENKKLLM